MNCFALKIAADSRWFDVNDFSGTDFDCVTRNVSGADLGALLAFWGSVSPAFPRADINGDGKGDDPKLKARKLQLAR